jgi:hypothetical protein
MSRRAGHEFGRVAALDSLHVAHLELHAASVLADPAEHAHGVADVEALLQHGHTVPDPGANPAAPVGELEIEKGASVATRAPLLARHREGRVDERARRELAHERATGHSGEKRPGATRAARPTVHPATPPRVSGAGSRARGDTNAHAPSSVVPDVNLAARQMSPAGCLQHSAARVIIDEDMRRWLPDRSPVANVVYPISAGARGRARGRRHAWRSGATSGSSAASRGPATGPVSVKSPRGPGRKGAAAPG